MNQKHSSKDSSLSTDQSITSFHDVEGPGFLSFITSMFGLFTDDPTESLPWLKKRYGDLVRLYLPIGGWAYFITRPDDIEYVLERNQKNYKKAEGYEELRRIMGNGLLTSEGDLWLRQHRLMMPMFHRKSVANFGDMIIDEALDMLDRWESNHDQDRPVNLLKEMKRITLIIICRALFSSDVEGYVDEVSEALVTLRKGFQSRVRGYRLPLWLPTPFNRKLKNKLSRLDDIVMGLIEQRKGNEEDYDDFLSMLMLAEDEETGEQMSQQQIRDEVMTFFLAGHETTANALTWTFYALSKNPSIHHKLRDHVTEVLPEGRPEFSMDLYEKLDYAGNVVDESLRKYPPVPIFAREATDEDRIRNYEVPEGTTIMMSQFVVHRDPEYWSDPMEFKPSRFEGEDDDEHHRFRYFPFGGGARMCIGRELALLEARLIMSLIVRRYRLSRSNPDNDIGTDVAITMEPDTPIRMNVGNW